MYFSLTHDGLPKINMLSFYSHHMRSCQNKFNLGSEM